MIKHDLNGGYDDKTVRMEGMMINQLEWRV